MEDKRLNAIATPDFDINLIQEDISGGKASISEIDKIAHHPNATSIAISGLDDETFMYFIDTYGKQFKNIKLWKCPKVSDLSPIETLAGLEIVSYFWNQKVERLWDMSRNSLLRDVEIRDFKRLHDLLGFANAKSIKRVSLEGNYWSGSKMRVDSLDPIFAIGSLESLNLLHITPEHYTAAHLGSLKNLRELHIPPNLFTRDEFAQLTASLEDRMEADIFDGIVEGMMGRVFVIGQPARRLNVVDDKDKIQMYQKEFRKRVERYKAGL